MEKALSLLVEPQHSGQDNDIFRCRWDKVTFAQMMQSKDC
jgi:hypothetical protein